MIKKKISNTIVNSLNDYFKLKGHKITKSSIEQRWLEHPKYPSMTSIVNVISSFGLRAKAVKVSLEQIKNLPIPILLPIAESLAIITEIDLSEGKIEIFARKSYKLTFGQLKQVWHGSIILTDNEQGEVKELNYKMKQRMEYVRSLKSPIMVFFFFILIGIIIIESFNMYSFVLVLKTLGFVIGWYLTRKELMQKLTYDFCQIGDRFSCEDVLKSNGAKIFPWLSMTDLVIYYFGFSLILLSYALIDPVNGEQVLPPIFIMSFLSLPWTLYSLFYQGFLVKKWCILCLMTILILWLESLFALFHFIADNWRVEISVKSIIWLTTMMIFTALLWANLKEVFSKYVKFDSLNISLNRIFNDSDVFRAFHRKEPTIDINFNKNEVVLGSSKAKNTILAILDPYCKSCAAEFKVLYELLSNHPDYANLVIRFVETPGFHQNKGLTSRLLISHYLSNPDGYGKLLKEWFRTRKFEDFFKKNPIKENLAAYEIFQKSLAWIENTKVKMTPTLYLNNRLFPAEYSIIKFKKIIELYS